MSEEDDASPPRPRKPLFTRKEGQILGDISETLRSRTSSTSVMPLTDEERAVAQSLDNPIIERPTTDEVCQILATVLDQAAEAGASGTYEEKRDERLNDAIRLLAIAGVVFPLDDSDE